MSLKQFLSESSAPTRSLVVVNRSAPDPIQSMLNDTFAGQTVSVDEATIPEVESDVVLLVADETEGAEVLAASPLSELQETVLLVNSDLYKTGTRGLADLDLPDVLAGLDEVPFRLRGYPESDSEKLLMIVISRFIERRAWSADAGTLRASFQRLSRIDDERGTRRVYETLGESGVQTHVYGRPDWQPARELDVVSHAGNSSDFEDTWFVVYTPPDGGGNGVGEGPASEGPASEGAVSEGPVSEDTGKGHVALLAVEVEPRTWEGFWTFRPSLVSDIDRYVAHNL